MRSRTTLTGWPKYDSKRHRFAVPNAVWEYRLRPVEFVIFSYLCRHGSAGVPATDAIAAGIHMTAGTVKKYLDRLVDKGVVNENGTPALKCRDKKFFTLLNEIFLLRIPSSAFLVYAYLLLIEDRQSRTCHPSYKTIVAATGVSKNTVMKSVFALEDMKLIAVEPSSYYDKHGMKWKGNNLYTVLPVRFALELFYQRQFTSAARQKAQSRLSRSCPPQEPLLLTEQPTAPTAV